MKTLHHTETTWQGRKIIIDASDLTAEYGYIEVMALYPDGREIEGLLYMAFVRHGLRHYYYGLVHR